MVSSEEAGGDGEAAYPWRDCWDGEGQGKGNKRPVIYEIGAGVVVWVIAREEENWASEWIRKNQSGFENVVAALR